MEIRKIDNKEVWNSWLNAIYQPPFSQSFEWGEILSREGKETEKLAVMDNEEIVALALVEYHSLPFGWRYAFCPRGPVVSGKWKVESKKLYELFIKYLSEKNCIFFRIEPDDSSWFHPACRQAGVHSLPCSDAKHLLRGSQFQKVIDINPRATVVLNLKQSEEELLKKMHSKTRYNINLAERKNLRVDEEKNYSVFMKLMADTAKRDGFRLHPAEHYEKVLASPMVKQITIYPHTNPGEIGVGVYNGEQAIAVGVFIGFGGTFTYLYGASDYENRQFMAPYLIQWQGIKIGRELGFDFYDFFGIAPAVVKSEKLKVESEYEYDKNHQYAGVTRFKLGFGGAPKESAGTMDLILSPMKYNLYRLMRKLRRLI